MPTRLTVVGSKILLSGAAFAPVGVTVSVRTYQPGDMAIVKAMGANMVRVHVLWYNAVPQLAGDAYSPGSPGNFDPGKMATLQAMVTEAQNVGLWCDIAISGCGADFWTNSTVQAQHVVMWQFLATTFAGQPYIMAYELLCEPHPIPANPALISAVYTTMINAVVSIDAATPIIIGPGLTYDIRYLSQSLLGFPNLIYTFDWYEPTIYQQQTQGGGPNNWVAYPGKFLDTKGQRTDCPVTYPGRGAVDLINQQWLAGLLNVGAAFSAVNNVPVWCNQIGVPSATPGSQQWVSDCTDNFNAIGVGFCVWALRVPFGVGAVGNPFGSTNSYGDIGLYGQDMNSGVWLPNTGLIAMLTTKFQAAQAAPIPTGGLAVGAAGSGLVALNNLSQLPAPAASDIIPVLRTPTLLQNATMASVQAFVVNTVKAFGAVGDGITDDTGAIQGAINSGAPFYFPAGVYSISSTLAFNSVNAHGQVVRGSGPTASDGTGVGKAVIRPLAGVSVAIQIDGTPFGGYVQGFGLENLTIDMVNMADMATSVAVQQVQGFDCRYDNVRVINFGLNKVSWLFNAGAYTSRLNGCQGGQINFQGAAYTNQTTSIILTNCDIYNITHAFFTNVTLVGGAVQQPYTSAVPIVYLAPGTTPYGYLPNTAGLYAAVLTDLTNSYSFTSVGTDWEQGGGYPATYNDGTHGVLNLIRVLRVQATCLNTTFINPTFAGMYLLDYGLNTRLTGQALGGAAGIDITTGDQYSFGNLRAVGNVVGISNFANYLDFGTGVTFTINGSTGNANFNKSTVSPSVDGDQVLYVKNASGLPLYDFTTNGAGFAILNGSLISGYTDSFTTQSWIIDSSTGKATFRSLNVVPGADGNSIILWRNTAGTVLMGLNTNATASASTLYFENGITLNGFSDGGSTQTWSASGSTGNVTAKSLQVGATAPPAGGISTNGQIRTVGGTFAALPAAATIGNGARGFITDGTIAVVGNYGASITAGGGSNPAPVYSDGINWRIG